MFFDSSHSAEALLLRRGFFVDDLFSLGDKRNGPTRHSERRKEIVAPNDCGKKGGAKKEREKKEEEECGRAFQRELGREKCSESRRR